MTDASGSPTSKAITPDPMAVFRQPKWCMDQATSGTSRPPRANPRLTRDRARAR
jgi:hypothetical protein